MPTLSSILVQRGAAPMRAVEEAIARQLFHGGDLTTNLLELGAVREETLAPILAEWFGCPEAPVGALRAPPQAVLRLVPGELALRHGVFPLECVEQTLVLAASEPLPDPVADDLRFALNLSIRQVIAPLVRIRQAIAVYYGLPLERRYLRLAARLDGSADPSPSVPVPAGHNVLTVKMPRPVSVPSPSFATGLPATGDEATRLQALPASKNVQSSPEVVDDAPADVQQVESRNVDIPKNARLPSASAPLPGPPEFEADQQPTPLMPPAADGWRVPTSPSGDDRGSAAALAPVLRVALQEDRASAAVDKLDRKRGGSRTPRRKGPLTVAGAGHELDEALTADSVLDVLFSFALQFFEYSALFIAHGDTADGREASGPGASTEKVANLRLPLDAPSMLAQARKAGAPVVAAPADDGLDADLAQALGRPVRGKAIAILPVVVRTRVVAFFYGDDGDVDVLLPDLADVLLVLGLAAKALERIAVRKKLGAKSENASSRESSSSLRAIYAAVPPTEAPATNRPPVGWPDKAAQGETLVRALDSEPAPSGEAPVGPNDDAMVSGAGSASTIPGFAAAPAPEEGEGARAPRVDSWAAPENTDLPRDSTRTFDSTATTVSAMPKLTPGATRRGPAPAFEMRAGRSSGAPPFGFEPLPLTPPPNATAWASPSSMPPGVSSHPRRSERPIPREDVSRGDEVIARRGPLPPVGRGPQDGRGDTRGGASGLTSVSGLDGGAGYAELIDRVVAGSADRDAAFAELVRNGEQVIQVVMARFPGPLRVDRHRARTELPPASQCGPILELVVAIRRPALPFVSVRTSSTDVEIRFWATHVLGELLFSEAANVLVPRLFDDDLSVRQVARQSASALANAGSPGAPILKGLDHIARSPDNPVQNRLLAIEAMGEIRVNAVVPCLIAVLDDSSDQVVEASRRALLLVTRQDHGRDVHRWYDWWANNGGRHRIEWLIDALMHEQPAIRRAAGDELKLITREYFGYYDDLPWRERERAQALYRSWWEQDGRIRFERG